MTFEPVHPIFWDFSDGDPWVLRYLRRYAGRVRKVLKGIWKERIDQLGWMLACAEPGPNDPLKLNTLAFIRNELHNLVGKGCADAWPLMLEVGPSFGFPALTQRHRICPSFLPLLHPLHPKLHGVRRRQRVCARPTAAGADAGQGL